VLPCGGHCGAGVGGGVSIDTTKASVARAAIAAGATIVNDVSALRAMRGWRSWWRRAGCSAASCTCWASRARCRADPRYTDVVDDVKAFLDERMAFAVAAGVEERRIVLDPGIGFGKTVQHNSSCCGGSASSPSSAGRCWWHLSQELPRAHRR